MAGHPAPRVDIVVPVYNEGAELEANVLHLRWFLDPAFLFEATVTVADNASTDRTWEIAADLARRVPGCGRCIAAGGAGTSPGPQVAHFASVGLASTVAYLVPPLPGAGGRSVGPAVPGGLVVVLTSLALTMAGLGLVGWLDPGSAVAQVIAVLVATGLAALVRFVLLRAWMFRDHLRAASGHPAPPSH